MRRGDIIEELVDAESLVGEQMLAVRAEAGPEDGEPGARSSCLGLQRRFSLLFCVLCQFIIDFERPTLHIVAPGAEATRHVERALLPEVAQRIELTLYPQSTPLPVFTGGIPLRSIILLDDDRSRIIE